MNPIASVLMLFGFSLAFSAAVAGCDGDKPEPEPNGNVDAGQDGGPSDPEDAGPSDGGCEGDPGCCCSGDARYSIQCTNGEWTCAEGQHFPSSTCNDPCNTNCSNPGLVGVTCCDEAGSAVGQVTCTSDGGIHACTPAGSVENCGP